MECTLCNGAMKPWLSMSIDAVKNERTPYCQAWKCSGCGSAAIRPTPPATEIASFYDLPGYYTHISGPIDEVKPNLADQLLAKLAWSLDRERPFDPNTEAQPGDRVIDLGCGHGAMLGQFKAKGCHVIGVDPDPVARETAARAGIEVLDGTAETLPSELEGRTFDLVIMSHSLEHCRDPALALRHAHGLTKPGGKIYVEVPNCACVHFESLNVCSGNFDAPRHLWFFTPDSLKWLVSNAGFSLAGWRFHGFTRHHVRSWRDSETLIADRLKAAEPARKVARHSYLRSLSILARSALASFDRKYDAIGIVATRSSGGGAIEDLPNH